MSAALVHASADPSPESDSHSHPLDPLSLAEIQAASDLIRRSLKLEARHRFPMVRLEEPTKAELRAGASGHPIPRRAFAIVLDTVSGEACEVLVDLRAGAISARTDLPVHEPPYGQPPIMIEEFMRCEAIVKADPAWRAALARRGLSEAEIDGALVDPFSSGFFGRDYERGRRIVRTICYLRRSAETPPGALRYARAPRPRLLPHHQTRDQITAGLSLWLDEKRGSRHPQMTTFSPRAKPRSA